MAKTAADETVGGETHEFARQVRDAWRAARWLMFGLAGLAAFLVLGQAYLFFDMARAIHPWAGWAFLAILALALWFFVARPLAGFLVRPALNPPPAVDLGDATSPASAFRPRARFNVRFLKALSGNPALTAQRAEARAAWAAAKGLERRIRGRGEAKIGSLAGELATLERDRVTPLLAVLDKQVDARIHAEAVAVGAATAVSLNGTVDAFIVLWRNVNLIAAIGRAYAGRPDLRGTVAVLRDVALAVVVARAADDLSGVVGGALGRIGGMVAAPVIDGSVNAAMTLRLGHLAKKRCRAFEAWTPKTAAQASREVFGQLLSETDSVVREIIGLCGKMGSDAVAAAGKLGQAAGSGAKRVTDAIAALFGGGADKPA